MNDDWIIGDTSQGDATLVLVYPTCCTDLADAVIGHHAAALMRNRLLALLRHWSQGVVVLSDDVAGSLAGWSGYEAALWDCRARAERNGLPSLFRDMTRIKAGRDGVREGLTWALMACGGPLVAAGFGCCEENGDVTLLAAIDLSPYEVAGHEAHQGHPHDQAPDHEGPAQGHPEPL